MSFKGLMTAAFAAVLFALPTPQAAAQTKTIEIEVWASADDGPATPTHATSSRVPRCFTKTLRLDSRNRRIRSMAPARLPEEVA